MPPPRRQNPVGRAAAAFYDEPPEPEYFAPVGQGSTSFGAYISPTLAAGSRRLQEELFDRSDERTTKAAENFTRRLELGSRTRTLPYTEAAAISQSKLHDAQSNSGLRLNPFTEEQELSRTKRDTAMAQADLQSLPQDVEARNLQRDTTMERLRYADPMQEQLSRETKNPAHLLAYEHFLASAPDTIKDPVERKRHAYAQSLRLAQDEEGVQGLYDAYAAGELDQAALNTLIEPVDDANGNHFGFRIRNDPDARVKANAAMADSRMRRLRSQEERDFRRENIARDTQLLTSLGKEIDDLATAMKEGTATDAMKARLKSAMTNRETLHDRLFGGESRPAASQQGKPVDTKETSRLLR